MKTDARIVPQCKFIMRPTQIFMDSSLRGRTSLQYFRNAQSLVAKEMETNLTSLFAGKGDRLPGLGLVTRYARELDRFQEEVLATVGEDPGQWCLLRALEWNNWPIFLGQAGVPLLLLVFPWWGVISALVVADLIWSWQCERLISMKWAILGASFVRSRWVISLVSGTWLIIHGSLELGLLAAVWPLLSLVLVCILPPSKAEAIQEAFKDRLCREDRTSPRVERASP